MTTTTQRKARLAVALTTALAALSFAAPIAGASPPPKLSGGHMQWYRWHPSARALQGRAEEFGSTAVVGLESMKDLRSIRELYGFDRVRAIPELHAVEVSVDPAQVRALLANAPSDVRIRYVAPIGPQRRLMSMPNDPLLHTVDQSTGLPYEWQFGASRVDRALDLSQGSPTILVGTIDSGSGDVPDLTGKVDSRWQFKDDGKLTPERVSTGNDAGDVGLVGHGTAVASLIAANVDDGFGMAGFGGATHLITFRDEFLTDASIAIALAKLDSLGCRIINMSIGGPNPDSPPLVDALHKAAADGVLLVASAGNDAAGVNYPAAELQPPDGGQSFGLAVGASTLNGSLASFSSLGKHLSLVAPGSYDGNCSGVLVALAPVTEHLDQMCFSIWAGAGGARYGYLAGTSFSAPEVAGVAALVWAARPELKNYQVADILKQSARRAAASGWTPTMGCGVLDAAAAVELAIGRSGTNAPRGDACSTVGEGPPAWPTDVTAPTVVALPAFGAWGTTMSLPFRVTEEKGEVAASIGVWKNKRIVAHVAQGLFGIQSGQVYALAWQAPRKTKGVFHFCVTLTDRAGNKSEPSCAFIGLR